MFFLFLLVVLGGKVIAQRKLGDKYFSSMEYKKAIAAYQKDVNRKKYSNDPTLASRIADSYRIIKDYSNSAKYYKLAIEKGSKNADDFLHYGMILKTIGNYEDAEKQYKKCLELRPGDVLALNGLRSCENIKKWKNKPKEYEVTNIEKINTDKSEFSPVLWNNQLVFVADRVNDLIDFSHNNYNDQPYLNVYAAELKNGVPQKTGPLSKKLNSNYHDGPVSFSKDGATIYYTRVANRISRKKEFVNRAKIFIADFANGSLKNETDFPFNNDDYSVAHPSVSDDGQILFFSSDKPGGYGGMDIYFCKRGSSGWEAPVNLGPDINTSGNEEFPFIRRDGILFFSSDGLPGFGGLDVFSAYSLSGKWILRRNEGAKLNDVTDDFGVFFTNEKEGYFSSDRPGGSGSDDIYSFTFTNKSEPLEGFILTALDTASGAQDQKLILLDESGAKVAETRSDKKGYFKFENLEAEKSYLVKMDENDPAFSDYPRYYYADKDGNIMRATRRDDKNGKFIFNALPLRENSMSDIESDDDITLAGNVLYGDKNTPVANTTLVIKDEKGHIIDQTTTNDLGSFAFRKLPPGNNYLIEIADTDSPVPPDARVIITNKNGKEVKVMRADSKGKFQVKVLAQETNFISEMNADDKDLAMDLSGIALSPDRKVLSGSKVYLLDEKGNKIAETTTNKDGSFIFKNLPSSKNYMISLDSNDPSLAVLDKIFFADKNGMVFK